MYEITLFGTTTVQAGDAVLDLDLLPGGKPRRLLEMICLAAGAVVSKERLVDQLWDGSPPPHAVATMATYVSVLRRAVEPGVPAREAVVRTAPGGYRLDLDRAELDLLRFDGTVAEAAATTDDERALGLWERAVALADRTVLEHEPYADWAEASRRHYRRRWVEAAVAGSSCALRCGRLDRAEALARLAVDRDPTEEDAWRALIGAHGRSRRPAAAARAFAECRRALHDELGLSPGPQTLRVLRAALEGDGDDRIAEALVM